VTARQFCDRSIALAGTHRPFRHARLTLVATILASSLDYIDGSAVNVGLPAIGRDLHGDAAALQWVVNGYLLPLSALLLTGGALGDRFGRRRILTIGIALFAVGSAATALAPNLAWLIAARALQGVAAAMMLPNSLAVLGSAFDGPERNRAIGIWAASAAIATAVGPVLGGWLIDTVGWRAIFLINLPLAAVAVALTLFALDHDPPAPEDDRLDLAGAAAITAALIGLTWALTQVAGARGWSGIAIMALAAGGGCGVAFIAIEKRLGDRAMAPLALFGSAPLVALNTLTFLLYGVVAGYMLLLPYLLITQGGYAATAAGAALLPFPIIVAIGSPLTGLLASRIGARPPLIVGAVLVAGGCLLATLAPVHASAGPGGYWTSVLPSVAILALGMAFVAAPLTSAVLGSVDARHTGSASGMNSALAQLGGVVVIAMIGGVLARNGPSLARAFDWACVAGAITALVAGGIIVVLLKPSQASAQTG
jgi:EmrB/QacA subfamily drug resistance transporter